MQSISGAWRSLVALCPAVVITVVAAAHGAVTADRLVEAPFLAETRAATDRMVAGMGAKPTGDVDRDFAAMMIPHHQGAIDMARAELRHGQNAQLRWVAQETIVAQQQEIAAMTRALDTPDKPAPIRTP